MASFQSVFFWASSQVHLQMLSSKPRLSVWCWTTSYVSRLCIYLGKL